MQMETVDPNTVSEMQRDGYFFARVVNRALKHPDGIDIGKQREAAAWRVG